MSSEPYGSRMEYSADHQDSEESGPGLTPVPTWRSQRKARLRIWWLSLCALAVLYCIAMGSLALKREQVALQGLEQIRQLAPKQKLVAVRKMAMWDQPLSRPDYKYDLYQDKLAELVRIDNQVFASIELAKEAMNLPMFPVWPFSEQTFEALKSAALALLGVPHGGTDNIDSSGDAPGDVCAWKPDGQLRLPNGAENSPEWMRAALRDLVGEFCFQINVVYPDGSGSVVGPPVEPMNIVPSIQSKVEARTQWILPFLCGILGTSIFFMQSAANSGWPSPPGISWVMRMALGGVAGVVIGWFASALAGLGPTTKAIAFPLLLAFLAGYCIDMFFALLNRSVNAFSESTARTKMPEVAVAPVRAG